MSICPWVLFPFYSIPPPPNIHPLLAVILLSIHESVSIFLVSLVCSLDSTYEWIICYLSFSAWLISFTIMFSMAIHTATQGKIFISYRTFTEWSTTQRHYLCSLCTPPHLQRGLWWPEHDINKADTATSGGTEICFKKLSLNILVLGPCCPPTAFGKFHNYPCSMFTALEVSLKV